MERVRYRVAVRWRWWFHVCLACWQILRLFGIQPSAEGLDWYIRRGLVLRTTRMTGHGSERH